jgi:hypothetical protein
MNKILTLCAFALLFSTAIFADVRFDTPTPKPKAGKSIATTLRVQINRNATEAKLIIPKNQLKQLRAELEELDDADDRLAFGFGKAQTVVSGMFLSLAFVFGGVWLVRSRKINPKASKTLVIGAAVFLSGALATIVFANAGPPPEASRLTNKFFSEAVNIYKFGSGKIKLEVSTEETTPLLIVPNVPDEKKPNGEE